MTLAKQFRGLIIYQATKYIDVTDAAAPNPRWAIKPVN
jgi:hypothetical protein